LCFRWATWLCFRRGWTSQQKFVPPSSGDRVTWTVPVSSFSPWQKMD
jgi:hypothetical protein